MAKLSGKEEIVRDLLAQGLSQTKIADIYHVNRMTVAKFIKDNRLI